MSKNLANRHIRLLQPYSSARKIGGRGTIWLNANERPTPPVLTGLSFDDLNRYPKPQPACVIDKYARYAGVPCQNILMTRGGDEGIELVLRTFCEAYDKVLYCPPTYGMYQVSCETLNLPQISVPYLYQNSTFVLDEQTILQNIDDGVKVLLLCNPNNPTGTMIDRQTIINILSHAKQTIVVVDEAYIEFSLADSVADLLAQFDNLIIIRTLSKAFGLAGIRAGFVLANASVIGVLQKVIAPYPIPTPTAMIARWALADDNIAFVKDSVAQTLADRKDFVNDLMTLPCVQKVYASHANFVLVKFKDGQAVFDALWQKGIIVRNQHTAHLLQDCIRISIGSACQNRAVIDALRLF